MHDEQDDADWWKNQDEERAQQYDPVDHPPILQGKSCPKCGSKELFVTYQDPHWFWALFGAKDYLVVQCCGCSYTEKLEPLDRRGK